MSNKAVGDSSVLPEQLIQLVPRFRPDIEGLGQFAFCLGAALWKSHQVPSKYIVWKQINKNSAREISSGEEFPHSVLLLSESSAKGLSAELDRIIKETQARGLTHRPIVLLHYTSYAFSKEGIAWWLPAVLRRFIGQGGRIVCFFHELYAKGRFLNKTWLTSGLQKRIFREVLALSSVAITSNADYLDEMRRNNRGSRPLVLSGIGSNVGELQVLPAFNQRSRRLAIFGLYATRKRLYEQHLALLCQLVERLGIEEVADIGTCGEPPEILDRAKNHLGKKLRIYGALPAGEVSRLLADSIVGVVNYDYQLRTKSGIIAAYQSHGVPTIIFSPIGIANPSLVSSDCLTGEQLVATDAEHTNTMLQQASRDGFAYYQEHRSYAAIVRQIFPLITTDND